MSIVQGTLPVGSLDQAITLNVQSSGGSHFETVTDTTPYLHRASPQDVASSMKLKKVVGGTIAWNQMWNADSEVTVTAGAILKAFYHYVSFVAGHKYLATYIQKNSMGSNNRNTLGYRDGTTPTHYQSASTDRNLTAGNYYWMFSPSNSETNGSLWIWCHTPDVDVTYANPQLFDLTQMYGSTIADYIYSLEQAHAGDGVAWFKALFGEDYYSYNAGELMSVKTSAHKTVGFNHWDEVWELGDINATTGQNEPNDTLIRSKNYIPVLSNTVYYFLCVSGQTGINWRSRFYDANKNYIGTGGTLLYNATFTTPSNAYYCRFTMQQSYGTTYKHDICINLSSSRNGEYEPYEEHTYPLDSDLELRGIPKLDADHKLYYDGDTYTSDGNVQRKYGTITFDGSSDESWLLVAYGDRGYYRAWLSVDGIATTTPDASIGNIICNKFAPISYSKGAVETGVTCRSGYAQLNFFQPTITSLADWKTWLSNNPVTVVYELATSTTESADAYTQAQRVGATEEFVDGRTVEIPVGNVSEYKRLIQGD